MSLTAIYNNGNFVPSVTLTAVPICREGGDDNHMECCNLSVFDSDCQLVVRVHEGELIRGGVLAGIYIEVGEKRRIIPQL